MSNEPGILKSKLTNQLLGKFKSYTVPQYMIDLFDDTYIKVYLDGNKKVIGEVICVVCHTESEQPEKIKPKSVFCKTKQNGSKYWILSNFTTHFDRAHKNVFNRTEDEITLDENEMDKSIPSNEINKEKSISNISIHSMNYSSNSLDFICDLNSNDMDKTEKLFNDQISKQLIKMWNVTTINGEQTQRMKCNFGGKSVSLEVASIPSDGNCMFSSLAHQLFLEEIDSSKHKLAVNNLRKSVVKYIEGNINDFKYELHGHVLEMLELDETVNKHGIDQVKDINEASEYLLKKCLIKPDFWGGGETLKAVAFLHDVNILVFHEDGPVILSCKSGQLGKQW